MVVVLIISVLSVLALPSYNDYVRRSQIVEAVTTLADFRVKMEQFYLDNRSYGTGTTCGVGNPSGKYFSYSCSLGASDQTYTMTASGISGAVSGANRHVYTINEANQKSTTTFKGASVTGKNCWLVKTNSDC